MAHYVDFNRLSSSARMRLVHLLTNRADPALVHSTPGHRDRAIFKGVVVALGAIAALGVMAAIPLEFSHDATGRRQLTFLLAGILFVTFATAFSLVYRLIWKPPAWNWDVDLATGACLIRVERSRVGISPAAQLGRPEIVHHYRNGAYTGSRVNYSGAPSLWFGNKTAPVEFVERFARANQVYAQAARAGDTATVRALDPFWEAAQRGSYEEPPGSPASEPRVTKIPTAVRAAGWFIALFLAGAVAGAMYVLMEFVI
jgi:hypothetical protein